MISTLLSIVKTGPIHWGYFGESWVYILNSFKEAFLLVFTGGTAFYRIVFTSLVVSGSAAILASLIGIPLGIILYEFHFRGKQATLTLVHTFMAMPPVVAGVFFYLLFSRKGPFGSLELLFSVPIMIIVQIAIALPIIIGFAHASMEGLDPRLRLQTKSLGANRLQIIMVEIREVRAGLIASIIAGFGRVIAEVGAVMIVGGSILGQTRVLTTDIVLKNRMGLTNVALGEGMILIFIALIVNGILTRLQTKRGEKKILFKARLFGKDVEFKVTGYPS